MVSFAAFRSAFLKGAAVECGGGNGCPAYVAHAEAMIDYDLLQMAKGLPNEGFPNFSAKDFAEIASTFEGDTLWTRYCNAWVAFAALRWPQVTAVSWRVYLTHRLNKNFGADL